MKVTPTTMTAITGTCTSDRVRIFIASDSFALTVSRGDSAHSRLLVGGALTHALLRLPRGHRLLELLVGHRDEPRQIQEHVINRAVSVAFPVSRIDHPGISRRVVVPGRDLQDRTYRQERSHIVFVHV